MYSIVITSKAARASVEGSLWVLVRVSITERIFLCLSSHSTLGVVSRSSYLLPREEYCGIEFYLFIRSMWIATDAVHLCLEYVLSPDPNSEGYQLGFIGG